MMDDASSTQSSVYEVYAIKFAEHPGAPRGTFFFGPGVEAPDELLKMDYYFWVIRSASETILFDVGFSPETAERRQRPIRRSPLEALSALGLDPESVSTIVLSHLHYDHVGGLDQFPNARFVVQPAEMAFWTGRHVSRNQFRWLVEAEDISTLLRLNYEGRVHFADRDENLTKGISVHLVGGHTPGAQVMRVRTGRGHVVLASDSSPLYANFEEDAPFGILTDLPASLDAFDRLYQLADDPGLIVPGHDPLVLERFDEVPGQGGLTVRIA